MTKEIILGGGCFWCVEAVFQKLKGVVLVESGYAGGEAKEPSYREVSNGNTNHAEVIKVVYDENIISTKDILIVFFASHDPTTLNRQGADQGTQYRSVIYYTEEEQEKIAKELINEINNDKDIPVGIKKEDFENIKVVTELAKKKDFYKAEDYHQNYYEENKNKNSYCMIVINPKIDKLQKRFSELLK